MSSKHAHYQKAIAQINVKPVEEIDFTQHQLENGYTISTQERVVKEVSGLTLYILISTPTSHSRDCVQVQAPAMVPPTDAQFFSREDPTKPDVAFLKNHFYREGRLREDQALYIIEKATEVLRSEPNLLSVDAPVTGALSLI